MIRCARPADDGAAAARGPLAAQFDTASEDPAGAGTRDDPAGTGMFLRADRLRRSPALSRVAAPARPLPCPAGRPVTGRSVDGSAAYPCAAVQLGYGPRDRQKLAKCRSGCLTSIRFFRTQARHSCSRA